MLYLPEIPPTLQDMAHALGHHTPEAMQQWCQCTRCGNARAWDATSQCLCPCQRAKCKAMKQAGARPLAHAAHGLPLDAHCGVCGDIEGAPRGFKHATKKSRRQPAKSLRYVRCLACGHYGHVVYGANGSVRVEMGKRLPDGRVVVFRHEWHLGGCTGNLDVTDAREFIEDCWNQGWRAWSLGLLPGEKSIEQQRWEKMSPADQEEHLRLAAAWRAQHAARLEPVQHWEDRLAAAPKKSAEEATAQQALDAEVVVFRSRVEVDKAAAEAEVAEKFEQAEAQKAAAKAACHAEAKARRKVAKPARCAQREVALECLCVHFNLQQLLPTGVSLERRLELVAGMGLRLLRLGAMQRLPSSLSVSASTTTLDSQLPASLRVLTSPAALMPRPQELRESLEAIRGGRVHTLLTEMARPHARALLARVSC